jgi:hypothetical protein
MVNMLQIKFKFEWEEQTCYKQNLNLDHKNTHPTTPRWYEHKKTPLDDHHTIIYVKAI